MPEITSKPTADWEVAVPTLVKNLPPPLIRIIGDTNP